MLDDDAWSNEPRGGRQTHTHHETRHRHRHRRRHNNEGDATNLYGWVAVVLIECGAAHIRLGQESTQHKLYGPLRAKKCT